MSVLELQTVGDSVVDDTAMITPTKPESTVSPPVLFIQHLQGLRAFALILVILYHTQTPGFTGGGVGVDVFFALSGYIITTVLCKRKSTVGAFYAKRMRRLLPSASVVLIITILWSYKVMKNNNDYNETTLLAQYASVSAANIKLIADIDTSDSAPNTDYWHTVDTRKFQVPILNYWSLGVEEQFYLCFAPFFIIGLQKLTDTKIRIVMIVIGITSLFLGQFLTVRAISFYGLPTRLWQMLAGCLFAFGGQVYYEKKVPSNQIRNIVAWCGLVGMILIPACVVQIQYPGFLALVPIVGTLGVIATPAKTFLCAILSRVELGYIGDVSYTIYLTHWPFIVLGNLYIAESQHSLLFNWLCVLASVTVAIVIYRCIESPIRYAKHGLYIAVCLTIITFLLALFLKQSTNMVEPDKCAQLHLQSMADVQTAITTSLQITNVDVLPVNTTDVRAWFDAAYNISNYTSTVMLLGDSHMLALLSGLQYVAIKRKWRVYPFTDSQCGVAGFAHIVNNSTNFYSDYKSPQHCTQMYERLVVGIRSGILPKPDIVLVAGFRAYGGSIRKTRVYGGLQYGVYTLQEWDQGYNAVQDFLQPKHVIQFGDNPDWPFDPTECLTVNNFDASKCRYSVQEAREWQHETIVIDELAARRLNATYIDNYNLLCTNCTCVSVVGNIVTMRDRNHISAQYSTALGPVLDTLIPAF